MSICKGLDQTLCKQRLYCTYANGVKRKYCKTTANSLANQYKELKQQYNNLMEENMDLKEKYNELIEDRINTQNSIKEERYDLYEEICELEKILNPSNNNDTEDSLFVKNNLKVFEKLKNKLKKLKTRKVANPKSLKNRYKKTIKRRRS